jgi:UDP-N-acetylglucosamine 2-epimerase
MPTLELFDQQLLTDIQNHPSPFVHIIIIATKPDIIKQAPLYQELIKRDQAVLICHTGQHYDFRYSGGMEEEFGLKVGAHLSIDGNLHTKIAQIIERFGEVLTHLKSINKIPIPYIHGDTMTCMAVGLSSIMHQVSCVHVEAGIRTLTPKAEIYHKFYNDFKNNQFNWDEYYHAIQNPDNLELGSLEPFPEQINTRMSEPASGFYATPVELTKQFLINEGFVADKIQVVGNTVADATFTAIQDSQKSTIFEKYPALLSGKFIRFCVHRRENTQDQKRFTVLFEAMEKLVQAGQSVLLISLFATEEAIDKFGLRDRLNQLIENYPETFIYSDVWPHYYDVIAAMQKCSAITTDSGSMQEEMNILGIPCVTLRFGSDRGETFIAGSNVPAPPIDSDFIVAIIQGAINNQQMKQVGNIYGTNVSAKIIEQVLERLHPKTGLFQTEEQRLGF